MGLNNCEGKERKKEVNMQDNNGRKNFVATYEILRFFLGRNFVDVRLNSLDFCSLDFQKNNSKLFA
jgi:hypothetical protein